MKINSTVENNYIESCIVDLNVSSTVLQETVYSEELDYLEFNNLLRLTQERTPRSIEDDKLRTLQ